MPQSNTTTWLEFALQQIAAESYLDTVNINVPGEVVAALIRGNNRPGGRKTGTFCIIERPEELHIV